MTDYCICFLDIHGQIRGTKAFNSSDDAAAIRRAEKEAAGAAFELRQGDRILAMQPPNKIKDR